jgi:hypothetical protein
VIEKLAAAARAVAILPGWHNGHLLSAAFNPGPYYLKLLV